MSTDYFNNIKPGLLIDLGEGERERKYVLLKVIGMGNYASVWITYSLLRDKFYAMKLQYGESFEDGKREVEILRKIKAYQDKNKDEYTGCVSLIDAFNYDVTLDGEDEEYRVKCSVYDIYAGSLEMVLSVKEYANGLPLNVVKNMAIRILAGLNFLHEEMGIIHCDLKPENILFTGVSESVKLMMKKWRSKDIPKQFNLWKSKLDKALKASNDKEFVLSQFDEDLQKLCYAWIGYLDDIDHEFARNFPDYAELEADEEIDDDDAGSSDSDSEYSYEDNEESEDIEYQHVRGDEMNSREQSENDMPAFMNEHEIEDFDSIHDDILNSAPRVLRYPIDLNKDYVTEPELAITDFGCSWSNKKKTKNTVCDRHYRAPEIIMDVREEGVPIYSFSSDIFSAGIVMYELITGKQMFAFPLSEEDPMPSDIHHLYRIQKILGNIPANMIEDSHRKEYLFDRKNDYKLRCVGDIEPIGLKAFLKIKSKHDDETIDKIVDFLQPMLEIDPSKRANAEQMLKHSFLQQ